MKDFMMPNVKVEAINESISRFIIEPLDRGYGHTFGNSMRRVLLSSLEGAAATAVQIDGIQHEFSACEGVIEDVNDIVLNLKGLVFVCDNPEIQDAEATMRADGPKVVTGADLKVPNGYSLINKEHVVANIAEGGFLDMKVRLGHGRGYVSAERNKRDDDPIGVIPIDSLFSPVKRVTFNVEDARVGHRTDFNRLTMEIQTNGSITPKDALHDAANIIKQHMNVFILLTEDKIPEEGEVETIFIEESENVNPDLEKTIDDLPLSVRAYNCLKQAEIYSIKEILELSESDLLNLRNFGVKSIDEVKEVLQSMGLSLKP
ncbi:MAG: DNA-directed RNA polymerase subunit alpha [Eggerthellaceae bacterium]|nr:DNA-directed RNA polymerase subunit alpha [Eggerthellaceae bacterium]